MVLWWLEQLDKFSMYSICRRKVEDFSLFDMFIISPFLMCGFLLSFLGFFT